MLNNLRRNRAERPCRRWERRGGGWSLHLLPRWCCTRAAAPGWRQEKRAMTASLQALGQGKPWCSGSTRGQQSVGTAQSSRLRSCKRPFQLLFFPSFQQLPGCNEFATADPQPVLSSGGVALLFSAPWHPLSLFTGICRQRARRELQPSPLARVVRGSLAFPPCAQRGQQRGCSDNPGFNSLFLIDPVVFPMSSAKPEGWGEGRCRRSSR